MSIFLGLAALALSHCLPAQTTPKTDPPAAVTRIDEPHITALATAVWVANAAYKAALESTQPAKSLDNMCDALPEILPKIVSIVRITPELAEVLKDAVADRLWAYTAVEYARTEAGDGYAYIFDLLAEALEKGGDPHTIRTDALAAPKRIRELAEQAGGDE